MAGETNRVEHQPFVRVEMEEAQAGNRLIGPGAGRRPHATDAVGDCAESLRARIGWGPFPLRGLAAELAERGIKTHPKAVWVFVHAEGLRFKKTTLPEEQTPPDVARKRARWKAHQGLIDPSRLVFIDETWVKTNMAPLRGWGRKGGG